MKSKSVAFLICISVLSTVLAIGLLVHRQATFMNGLNAGLVESAQGQIVSSYLGLDILSKVTNFKPRSGRSSIRVTRTTNGSAAVTVPITDAHGCI